MRKKLLTALLTLVCSGAFAIETVPIKGSIISPSDKFIQYTGRISFTNPERPAWNYPGVQIAASFEGTSLRMIAKPRSGYFVAQIDQAEPFKVAFRGERDSVVTLATALPNGVHSKKLVETPALPSRKIEFIGNSITCGYGNEGLKKEEGFDYATENHYYSYASITSRNLNAQHWVVARSGIGAYRNYGEAKTGSPRSCMPVQYEYTGYAWDLKLREEATFLREKWDFSRYQPDVICINLGTNDTSTNNYDLDLLKQGYQKLLKQVRDHNPKAKIVFLTGTMLYNKELREVKQLLDEVTAEAHKAGDKEVYRFDMVPISGEEFYGNDYHPNIYEDEKMAAELTAYLRSLMNWF